ncbi:hypothetical protein [Tabrizicola sp.]|uniref:hypothetical protein n=1 Tax=Tabrizicola sp. TaxID=2005166 RepID=UPI003F2C01ED
MVGLLRALSLFLIGAILVFQVAALEAFREDVASGVYDGDVAPSQDIVLMFIGLGVVILGLALFLLMTKR